MKHATTSALKSLTTVLDALRNLPALQEKRLDIFYLRSNAFLRFHEDAAGLFADAKFHGIECERLPLNTWEEQAAFLLRSRARYWHQLCARTESNAP